MRRAAQIQDFRSLKDTSSRGEDALCGFVKGAIAGGYDNEYLYVDGIARIAGKQLKDMVRRVLYYYSIKFLRTFQVLFEKSVKFFCVFPRWS